MALSGSIIKSFHSNKYSLILEWTATQSITNNTSTITSKLYLKSNSTYYSINSTANKTAKIIIDGTTYTKTDAKVGLSGNEKKLIYTVSKTLTHNADGTRSFNLDGELGVNVTLSGIWYGTIYLTQTSFTLNTIARASTITTFDSFTIGNSIPITISRASDSFTHDLTLKIGSTTVATRTGITTSHTLVLSSGEQDVLYNAMSSTTSSTVTLYCTTKSGSTTIGSTATKSVTATVSSSIVPTFTSLTATETITGVSTTVGKFVQNLSKIRFNINGATGIKGSTITSYQVTFNGVTYNSSSPTTGLINKSGTIVATGKITDSRGRTATKTLNITLLAYSTPRITTFNINRCNSDGTLNDLGEYAKVDIVGSVSSLVNVTEKNSLRYKIFTKPRGDVTWVEKVNSVIVGLSLNSSDILNTYAAASSYDFRIDVIDNFNTTISLTVLPTATVTMSWGASGIGVGKVWEQGALDVGGKTYLNGAIPTQEASSATLQVNGFMRTGNVYLHTGGGAPDGVRNADFLSNVNGELRWNISNVAYRVWHYGNDGAGSGLDADKVDGIESSRIVYGDNDSRTAVTSDLKYIWKSGFYNINGGLNNPETGWAWVLNMAHSSNTSSYRYGGQLAIGNGTGNFWFRSTNNYGDGTWRAVAHSHNIRHGRIDIIPTANSPTSVNLNYGITFNSTPTIVASAISSVPGSTVMEVSTGSPSTTSCNLYIYRTNTTLTSISWIATDV